MRSRPAAVEQAVHEKYATLAGASDSSRVLGSWVNNGEELTTRMVVSMDGSTTTLAALIAASGSGGGRILDLGTADGRLLRAAHATLGLAHDRIVGVSALDQRHQAADRTSLPDSSYLIMNLDLLHEATHPSLVEPFSLVYSSATFYHLVDPLGALAAAYDRLAVDGLLLIRHVPLAAQLGLPGTSPLSEACAGLSAFWRAAGHDCAISEMGEKPGLCLVAVRRGKDSPSALRLPYEYTGAVVSIGAGTGWRYARLREDAELASAADAPTSTLDDVGEFLRSRCGCAVELAQSSTSPSSTSIKDTVVGGPRPGASSSLGNKCVVS